MTNARVEESFPLSPIQLGMLVDQLRGEGRGVNLEQVLCTLREEVDAEALGRALHRLGLLHPTLRTRFRWSGVAEPLQEVLREAPAELTVLALPAERAEAGLQRFLDEDRRRGIDPAQAPLFRLTLLRVGPQLSYAVFTYAHALLDSCVGEVLRELFELLEEERTGKPATLPVRRPYRAHIEWLRGHLVESRTAALGFFRALLDGFSEPTRLTALERRAGPAEAGSAGYGEQPFELSAATSAALRARCAADGVRLSTVFDAAFALALGAFTGDAEVVFGSTRACRRSAPAGSESTVGLFFNTLPLRVPLDPEQPLTAWLRRLREQQQALRPHEHTPLVEVTACAPLPRGTKLFEHIVIFGEEQHQTRLRALGGAWASRELRWMDQTNFPLNLMAFGDPLLCGKLSYDRARFSDAAMARLLAHLVQLLEALAMARPEATLADLPRLLPAERARLAAWNRTEAPHPADPTVHGPFEAQAARTPLRTAAVFRGASLSYAALDAAADALAAELRGLGVGRGAMVGLHANRSLEMLVGLLGILKAGAAYVPLDPAFPRERIAWMLEDTRAQVVLTTGAVRAQLPPGAAHVIELAAPRPPAPAQRPPRPSGDDLAYVLFTSGSTGRPKGVQVRHRNVANFFAGMDALLGVSRGDAGEAPGTWLAVTSISFDISVLELFWTLARGFTVVLQEEVERSFGPPPAAPRKRALDFSLFYFAAWAGGGDGGDRYRLLLDGARFADAHGFSAVWTPERHFHEFGGLYPNPSLTSAALATITRNIQLRAGSVVVPLHNPIRCAEEWSVVDNLSGGRVGLSFASGWHANDFVLAPDNFADRRRLMAEGIETIRKLWRGEEITAQGGDGREVKLRIFPPPIQREPRIWLTASGNPETFAAAGRLGASVLTNLLVMTREELGRNIAVYRKAFREAGHAGDGFVSLMLHTFVGDDEGDVLRTVRTPFLDYLKSSTDLISKARWETTAFAQPGKARRDSAAEPAGRLEDLSAEEMEVLLDHAFRRYVSAAGLFGTPAGLREKALELQDLGVDELACLIDFGVEPGRVLSSLPALDELRRLCAATGPGAEYDGSIAANLRRHGVAHMQCTPSLAAMLVADPRARAELGGLRKLLLGGEALPPALLEELAQLTSAEVINMYGPTETTVWSSAGRVLPGAPITLGRPIANTQLAVVDRHLRALPPGVAGELLIGGAGVAAGYLDRPELTAARFVALPGEAGLWYRTGDLVRFGEDGALEFLGRLDHQVKIAGHRIELGEIEATLGRSPDVAETVVVARREESGEQRLVAYVVPRERAAGAGAALEGWKAVWEQTYREAAASAGGELAGWRSSYTSAALPQAEMDEWRAATVARVLELGPRRVLEIGSGTGLVLFGVAPHCARYLGLDLSAEAVLRTGVLARERGLAQVELQQRAAHELAGLAEGGFDVVVINSVAQYFPDVDYFLAVLDAAWAKLVPGGAIFAGDLRSLPLLEAFWASVETARAPEGTSAAELLTRVRGSMARERELVLDPQLFPALALRWPDLASARVRLKAGKARNEMSAFRYDVVLEKSGGARRKPGPAHVPERSGAAGAALLPQLREALAAGGEALRVLDLPNARVAAAVAAAAALQLGRTAAPGAAEAAGAGHNGGTSAVDPAELPGLHPDYDVELSWARSGTPGCFDALFLRRGLAAPPAAAPTAARPWATYANQPLRAESGAALQAALRELLRARLPAYMQPQELVLLGKLPRTPNGKIDRAALPKTAPAAMPATAEQQPRNQLETEISRVFEALLSVAQVGVETNFFELGLNSLLLVRASSKLEATLQRPVSLVDLFRFPSIRALAAQLSGPAEAPRAGVREGEDRAQARRDSLLRRAGARPKK